MKNYLFGYGSLISTLSRETTAKTGKAKPARVSGWQRAWNYHNSERNRNVLGVSKKKEAFCNGVIFPVQENELSAFDKRESGYERVEIDSSQIKVLLGKLLPGKFWIYMPKKPQPPTKESPLPQSYLDLVITGCLEWGEKFAEEFIKATKQWNYPWINNRNKFSAYDINKIDGILRKVIPRELGKRVEINRSSKTK